MTVIVREFSAAGPCIPLGPLVKRTATTVSYHATMHGGEIERRGGYRLQCGLIHTEPCSSCRDHERTQYPRGYEN